MPTDPKPGQEGHEGQDGQAQVVVDADTASRTLQQDDQELDEEAQALLQELASSQAEVKRMLDQQHAQALQLGGLKAKLAAELQDLQDDNWRMECYGELEALKLQLSCLDDMDAQVAASEGMLKAMDEMGADGVAPTGSNGECAEKGDAGEEGADVYDAQEIAELQRQLDVDLAAMFSQLQVMKREASEVTSRKAELEAELIKMLGQQEVEDAGRSLDQDGQGHGYSLEAVGEADDVS